MPASIIDGKAIAAQVRAEVAVRVKKLASRGVTPGFVDVLIGDDPASALYVGMKNKAAAEAGMRAFDHVLPAGVSSEEALGLIGDLNRSDEVHGIIVQSPLPAESQIDIFDLQVATAPTKDVDGLNPENQGLLALGRPRFVPATPAGVVELLRRTRVETSGRNAVVIGRSTLVGRPLSILLSSRELNATVTLCHTGTSDLADVTRGADILVVAAGRPRTVTADMVKPGAIVIDVGTNRTEEGLVGDVAFDEVADVAGAITPVPGGVGPMTVACLLANTVLAAERAAGAA